MKLHGLLIAGAVMAALSVSACTDDRNLNAATGALAGAAVGTQLGQGRGRTATTLIGAAAGTAIGANAARGTQNPQGTMCVYRNPTTGESWQAPCRN